MVAQVKDIVARSQMTLAEDLAGVSVLFLGLFALLSF